MMVSPTDSNGGAIELNTNTGLIGMPTLTLGGVLARSLINPQIKVGGSIHIDQSLVQGLLPQVNEQGEALPYETGTGDQVSVAADGMYTVRRIDYHGDTRGNPWYMDILALQPNLNTSETQAASVRN